MALEQSQPIPVEKGWPLLGILPKFLSGDPFEYLKNVMLERGDFVQLNFGLQPVYLVSHPDYLKRILWENYHNYRKPEMLYNSAKEMSQNGLFTSEGSFWLRQRRMIQPHLHRKALANLFSDMVDAIGDVLNSWELLAKNNTEVELSEKMGDITITVITRTMFGKGTLPAADVTEIGQSVVRMTKYIGETLYSTMLPQWFPLPGRGQFRYDLNATRKTVNQIIKKCRQEKEISASLINMLINSVDEESNEGMTEQQLFDEVMAIFTAGNETTATALIWLGVVIQNHPDILEKLHEEIDRVLGGRSPSFEDVSHLIYTRQVFMEILRMYTVVPFLPRALNKADQLGDYHLPAEAMILVFYHGVHHNPRVWDNPEVFDPERFAPENLAGRHAFAYVPFSAGPRKCAGDEFALLEGTLVIAMLLQKYNLNILPNQTFAARLGATMHARNGVKATFSIRASATRTS
jgi:cytochrome P450